MSRSLDSIDPCKRVMGSEPDAGGDDPPRQQDQEDAPGHRQDHC